MNDTPDFSSKSGIIKICSKEVTTVPAQDAKNLAETTQSCPAFFKKTVEDDVKSQKVNHSGLDRYQCEEIEKSLKYSNRISLTESNLFSLNHHSAQDDPSMSTALKDRRDVVNKSLLRAIRKFFCLKYKNEYPKRRFRILFKKVKYFENSILNLTQDLNKNYAAFLGQNEDDLTGSEAITNIVAFFCDPNMYKKSPNFNSKILSPEMRVFTSKFLHC